MSNQDEATKEVLKYLQAGMNDACLMDRFRPAYEGLNELFQELAEAGYMRPSGGAGPRRDTRRISVKQIVADIRGGMDWCGLMARYDLSSHALRKALQRLVEKKAVEASEIPVESAASDDAAASANSRRFERYCLDFQLPVWEAETPGTTGEVLDITEKGLGVLGLPVSIDETKNLVIFSEEFLEIDQFSLLARCRWVKRAPESGDYVAGFEICGIHEKDLAELRKVIELMKL
jgi:hypothetical protein